MNRGGGGGETERIMLKLRWAPSTDLKPAFIACRLVDSRHPDWCVMLPHCGFDLHFSYNA